MKKLILILILFLLVALMFSFSNDKVSGFSQATGTRGPAKQPNIMAEVMGRETIVAEPDFGNIPLYFIPNLGQVNGLAQFYAKTSWYTLWMTKEGLMFDAMLKKQQEANYERGVSGLTFLKANKNPEIIALEPTGHRVNYFIGNDPAQWRRDIPTSQAVLYKEIYPRIDLKVYGIEKQVEYDWLVRPGGEVENIRFEYKDVKEVKIDQEGNLAVKTRFGELIHHKPSSYQRIKGKKVEVASEFRKFGENIFGFLVRGYQRNYELIIDPKILVYSTYLGGTNEDHGYGIAVDSSGAVYAAGWTTSADFPLQNAFQNMLIGETDAFVAKLTPAGNALVFSTYLGGKAKDKAFDIAVDSSGAAYVTGYTSSSNFPLQNPYQNSYKKNSDVFVTKLTPGGDALAYSTFLGGGQEDVGNSIVVDTTGAASITGRTNSADFPLQNPYQNKNMGSHDVFVAKLKPAGNELSYSTYLGGTDKDVGEDITVDSDGAAYVTGYTYSPNFPLQNPFQKVLKGASDAFVVRFTQAGDGLVYCTYLGGSSLDYGKGIAVDDVRAAYVTGVTSSADFPIKNPYQNELKGFRDAFATKFTPAGNKAVYSTYLGGDNEDFGWDIAVDHDRAAYVAGRTSSSNFPVKKAYQEELKGITDAFVTKFSPAGNGLVYSTYLGGSADEEGIDIALDSGGDAYVVGWSYSVNFPQKNPYQNSLKGSSDAFVTKIFVPEITLASPNGGETWKVNSSHNIKWRYTAGDLGTTLKIELLRSNQFSRMITRGVAIGSNGKGSYKWKIPTDLVSGGNYKIRITSKKYADYTDASDKNFKITR